MQLNNAKLICDTIDNGIILLNKDLKVLFWNRWLERRTNISQEEIENKNLKDFFTKLNHKKLKRKIETSLKLNIQTYYTSEINKYLLDIKLNKITNKIFDYMQQSVTISPYSVDEDIVILYIYDTTLFSESNFTLQKAKEDLEKNNEQLIESNNEIDLILDTTMEAILLYEDCECKKVNKKALELFDYDKELDFKDKTLMDLVEKQYHNDLKEDKENPFEVKMIKKDGQLFDAIVQIKNMKFKNSELKLITIMDISDIKEKDKILSDQSKMAALGEMLANIAHQWRQPLSAISTIASGIQLQKEMNVLDDEDFNDGLTKIVEITYHLSDTIEDFSNFLKEEKTKTKFNIKENMGKTLGIIDDILRSAGIELIINIHDNPEIENYANELTQCLLNIINNAKDALNELEILDKYIIVDVYKEENEKNIIIEIKDNAKGIEDAILKKIFEPYFTTKHKDQGTGLGLYMTHQLINSMKGEIYAKNSRFKYQDIHYNGACFIVKLPID